MTAINMLSSSINSPQKKQSNHGETQF